MSSVRNKKEIGLDLKVNFLNKMITQRRVQIVRFCYMYHIFWLFVDSLYKVFAN